MVQKANVGVSVGSTVLALGADGIKVYDVVTDLGAKNEINKSLSPSFVSPFGLELDLDTYLNNPASGQPTKKALCGDQMSLVTAAWSTSTSASPAPVSLYYNKRTTISSPAKGKMALPKSNPPFCGNKQPVIPLPTFCIPYKRQPKECLWRLIGNAGTPAGCRKCRLEVADGSF
jgi:hypothetical protein